MAKMTTMAAAVRILQSEGVKYIFGIPGAGILPFYRALKDLGTIKHMVTRHEESAIHMADGYARALGTVGVCAATSGPGASNFVTGLYTAQVDSIPILALTGQNVRAQLDREAFQAVNIAEVVKPITKKSYCIKDPAMVPWVFREAFKIMREGRPGPVLIDLPLDVQKEEIEYDPEVDAPLPILRMPPNAKQIQKTVDMLLAAEKPVMLLGGGVLVADACKEFVALAEALQIPVVSSYMGKSGIPWNHPLMAGHVGIQCNTRSGNQVFLDSTLVLAVGARFNDRHTGDIKVYKGSRKFIHVDIDPGQIGKNIMPDLGICADAKVTLQALLDEVKRRNVKRPPTKLDISQIRAKMERKTDYDNIPIKPQRVFKEINEFFDEETVFVTCIGLNQIWSGQLQKISKPRHYLDCGGAGPLGWDMPASIGAKVARPDKVVVDVVGDFGFQFCMDALPVAVMYKVPFVIVVLNNGYLGLIRQAEKYMYDMNFEVQIWYDSLRAIQAEQAPKAVAAGGRGAVNVERVTQVAENEGRGFDFVKFAEACGAAGERVTDPKEIKAALK
ncbi:MAG: glyoxylate carboligase, partial [Syntrophobacteraceae bacterium]|nr:glyoxylate carboligase [Syntrophobacteraceae bacterium]